MTDLNFDTPIIPTDDAVVAALRQACVGGDFIGQPIDGGFRVKRSGAHYIDVLSMLVNTRIVTTPVAQPEVYDRFWCYQGSGPLPYSIAVLRALEWDPAVDHEPSGWIRNGQKP